MTECYRCWAEVDLDALRGNLAEIRTLAGPDKKILTVVKADAYGHGLRPIAALLMQGGTDVFGVANLAEARAIRSVGRGWPILMLGPCLPFEADAAVRDEIMATVSSLEEAQRLSQAAVRQRKTASVHLKIDTGMGRLGTSPESAPALLKALLHLPSLSVDGLFTHFSSAEDDPEFTAQQRHAFAALLQTLQKQGHSFGWVHASNSGGLLFEPEVLGNTIRPGLLVYGVSPPANRDLNAATRSGFRPALSWKCRVGWVKEVRAGTPISYGHTYTTSSPGRVATITAGYGDGYLRSASNRAWVLIAGRRCPVLGRVTMDQTVVDVSALPEVTAGEEVVLLGRQGGELIAAEQLASWCGTIPWEVLTNITYRVPRVYRGGHAA